MEEIVLCIQTTQMSWQKRFGMTVGSHRAAKEKVQECKVQDILKHAKVQGERFCLSKQSTQVSKCIIFQP